MPFLGHQVGISWIQLHLSQPYSQISISKLTHKNTLSREQNLEELPYAVVHKIWIFFLFSRFEDLKMLVHLSSLQSCLLQYVFFFSCFSVLFNLSWSFKQRSSLGICELNSVRPIHFWKHSLSVSKKNQNQKKQTKHWKTLSLLKPFLFWDKSIQRLTEKSPQLISKSMLWYLLFC